MFRILLIEDNHFKEQEVTQFLSETYRTKIILDVASSYQSAMTKASSEEYDFMIVDMSIPKYDESRGGENRTLPTGGELIINTLYDLGVMSKSIVLTQYDIFNDETINTIDKRLKADCGEVYMGFINYNSNEDEWKNQLQTKIDKLCYQY